MSTGKVSPGIAFDSNFPIFAKSDFGRYYTVICQCWLDDINYDPEEVRLGSGYDVVQFVVNTPPDVSDVVFSAMPPVGNALETKFTMRCSGGISSQPPLIYYLGYRSGDVDVNAISDEREFATQCVWLVIKCILTSYFIFSFERLTSKNDITKQGSDYIYNLNLNLIEKLNFT